MSFMEDFEKTAKKMLGEATHAAAKARKTAGEMTDANRGKIDAAIDKAGSFVDAKTEGKYADKVAKAKGAAGKGVDFVAKQKAADVPPRPAGAPSHSPHASSWQPGQGATPGGNATWADTSRDVQDTRPGERGHGAQTQGAPGVGGTAYPNPIPPYQPPTH